ncbi:hypothetical protein LB507_010043 [Fusarium sp. FIESC RH6]|nr:hypothetical protein LB507_010043 [Fusarium sp. FIESC RH6]
MYKLCASINSIIIILLFTSLRTNFVPKSINMSSSIQTLCRGARAAPQTLRLGLTQTRRLSTTDPSRSLSNGRDTAVHDPIMDKFWGNTRVNTISESSAVVTETPSMSTSSSRDPPLGTNVFEPSSAPRWSGINIPSGRQ